MLGELAVCQPPESVETVLCHRPSVVERCALGVARWSAGQSGECVPEVGDQQ